MRTLPPKLFLAVLTAGLVLAPAVTPAAAEHVQCGDVITQDTTLDSDLIDCPAEGLSIGADGVTLDLGGHLVDGGGGNVGIPNFAGYDGVTVRNGVIRDFADGLRIFDTTGSVVSDLDIVTSRFGHAVELVRSSHSVVEHNAITHGFEAIRVTVDSHDNLVSGNVVREAEIGIGTGLNAFQTVIDSNVVIDSEGTGIVAAGRGHVITNNVVRGSLRKGIDLVTVTSGVVDKNVITDAYLIGLHLSYASDGNRVSKNFVSNSTAGGTGFGIRVADSNRNLLEKNEVTANRDGISIGTSEANVVRHNRAWENADDGIEVETPGHTVAANVADRNGDLGIQAVPGTIDGGNNRARHNGNPAQCLNVSCR
jgi:parallel beta-helix repeat protein